MKHVYRMAPVPVLANLRLKLPARGGRAIIERSFLSAAAAGRSLSAFR
jgi:hypothetical protein